MREEERIAQAAVLQNVRRHPTPPQIVDDYAIRERINYQQSIAHSTDFRLNSFYLVCIVSMKFTKQYIRTRRKHCNKENCLSA